MAEGAWVPCFDSIWTSAKTRKLAHDLYRSDVDAAVSKFLRLCAWARDHTPSGDLVGINGEVIAYAIGAVVPSDRLSDRVAKGERFMKGLADAGFVTGEKLHIKGWEDGPGKLVAARARDRDRQAQRRDAERREREAKDHERALADDRQRRIAEAREAGTQRGPHAVPMQESRGSHAVPVRFPAAPEAAPPDRAETPVTAVTPPPVTQTDTPRPSDEGGLVDGRGTRVEGYPLPPTGSSTTKGRATRLAPLGKPDCGRCRDASFLHRSQANDARASYAGDCAACASQGRTCEGYSTTAIDPEIPDERSEVKA